MDASKNIGYLMPFNGLLAQTAYTFFVGGLLEDACHLPTIPTLASQVGCRVVTVP